LLGDFTAYKDSKKLEREQQIQEQQPVDFNMAPLPNTAEAQAELKKKKK
jgi:hypothetical protein